MVASHTFSYQASDLPTKHVTVYGDRAEVNRTIKIHLKNGANEILVTKLSRSLDSASIRVEGYGSAAISEVKYHEKRVVKEEEVKDREKQLHERLKKLKEEKKSIQQNLDRLTKQRGVLDGIANQIGRGPQNGDKHKDSSSALVVESNALDNLEKFLSYYERRADELDKNLNEITEHLEKIDEEISVVQNNLSEKYNCCGSHLKEVTIYVTATEEGEALLDLFYVVSNASWKPSYDIRVQTADPAMKIIYYGLIEQNTDEDWKDVKLTLSTATPMVGGQVPELGTTKVSFHKPPPPPGAIRPQAMAFGGASAMAGPVPMAYNALQQETYVPEMAYVTASVKENVTSSAFDIEVPSTIPSDKSSHKVTIAIIDLKPTFEYETVPSKSVYAYFKAKAQNSSPFPLLTGPIAVFVNNSFVANSTLKSVNSSESFDVSLGVDPALKVEYKAAKKFNEEAGILTKSSVLTHEQKICLHNAKNETVKLTVIEPFPQSTEEKLKVSLIEPVPQRSEKGVSVSINKNNNVEWQLKLGAQEKRDLILKYQIEHPKGEQLEYKNE